MARDNRGLELGRFARVGRWPRSGGHLRNALLACPSVFPSISRNGMGGRAGRVIEDTWAEVRRQSALPATMTVHGLRGAFITQAQRLGVPLATVTAMVGSESPLTTLRHYSAPTRGEVTRVRIGLHRGSSLGAAT